MVPAPLTVGVEEELLLVDPVTHALSHSSTGVLEAIGDTGSEIKHDLYEAQVEITSPPSRDVAEAVRGLRAHRREVTNVGAMLLGAGIHPSAAFGDVKIVGEERYMRERANLRGIVQRTPDCALHVHVGVPDHGTSIAIHNALREYLPLLVGLSGNSAFWHGVDSGFSCTRMVLRRAYPRTEVPPSFRDWAGYEETVARVLEAGQVPDYTFLWWDVRPHPKLGTVEMRVMDAQASLRDVDALSSLVHGIACNVADHGGPAPSAREALAESAFRATRDGVQATVWSEGRLRPLAELAAEAVALAKPYAGDAVEDVMRIVREGNGADRQRAAFQRGGMPHVLSELVAETAAG
ncbi:MAG TPA: YbdK family carboxylate-amine ligase [Thermoleophilaceae bacterium]|nr:YbdK family carboxylate-amine ligase [Thermoleophilaceae bacterium]